MNLIKLERERERHFNQKIQFKKNFFIFEQPVCRRTLRSKHYERSGERMSSIGAVM